MPSYGQHQKNSIYGIYESLGLQLDDESHRI